VWPDYKLITDWEYELVGCKSENFEVDRKNKKEILTFKYSKLKRNGQEPAPQPSGSTTKTTAGSKG